MYFISQSEVSESEVLEVLVLSYYPSSKAEAWEKKLIS